MAETYTAKYHWTLPEVQHSPSTWGGFLNDTLNKIDAQVYANQVMVTGDPNALPPTKGIAGYLTPNSLTLSKTGGTYAIINFANADAAAGKQGRWQVYESINDETGGNAGSNLIIQALDDNGAYLGASMVFNRSSQRVGLSKDPIAANDIVTKQYSDMGMVPIGGIIMWPGPNLPPRFTWCLGGHLNAAAYPQLFNVIGGTYFWDGTNFGLPNMAGRCVLGYDGSVSPNGWYLGRLDGEYNHTLNWNEMPQHNHGVSDPQHYHNLADPGHTHTGSQDNHIHYDAGHGHGASSSQDSHQHGLDHPFLYAGGGAWTTYVGGQRLDQGGNTDFRQPNVYTSIGTGYANIGGVTANGVYISTNGTGAYANWTPTNISIANAGSNYAHNNMQPSIVVGYIIRYA